MTIKPILALAAAAFVGTVANAQTPAAVDFEKEILPIFKNSCFKCHQKEQTDASGKVKKPKGKFRMDSAELLLKGGEEGSDLVPGDAAKSLIYTLSCLPASDDKVMPPDGKADALTAAQQELLKRWITEGAKFGTWKGEAQ